MSQERPSLLKRFKRGSVIFLGASTGVALVTLILWFFGVPGVDGAYAQGWKLGFGALLYYLMGGTVLWIAHVVTAWGARKFHMLDYVNTLVIGLFWILFVYSMMEMGRALEIMSSAY